MLFNQEKRINVSKEIEHQLYYNEKVIGVNEVTEETIKLAQEFIDSICFPENELVVALPLPEINAETTGEIRLSWKRNNNYIKMKLNPNGSIDYIGMINEVKVSGDCTASAIKLAHDIFE